MADALPSIKMPAAVGYCGAALFPAEAERLEQLFILQFQQGFVAIIGKNDPAQAFHLQRVYVRQRAFQKDHGGIIQNAQIGQSVTISVGYIGTFSGEPSILIRLRSIFPERVATMLA